MRLWSLHPKYLDPKGLVALWRETLFAQKVLLGETRGYRNHPQLNRFKESSDPIGSISTYLWFIYEEAVSRGYHFDSTKINKPKGRYRIKVNDGQVKYELQHLLHKLKERNKSYYQKIKKVDSPIAHPIFKVVKGEVEHWENMGARNTPE